MIKLEKPTCKSCYLRQCIPALLNRHIRQADQSIALNMLFYFLKKNKLKIASLEFYQKHAANYSELSLAFYSD